MHSLYEILAELDAAKIHHELGHFQPDVVTILVTVPGKRIEIEVESDGSVSTAFFTGSEDLETGIDLVRKVIEEFRD